MPFIVFEGGEGAGKTTQLHKLAEWLEFEHLGGGRVIKTREPGGAPNAEHLRAILLDRATHGFSWDPKTEVMLFAAARREHIVQTIAPALADKKWVLCDRFIHSSLVYQGYAADRSPDEIEQIKQINNFACTLDGTFFFPDLTLYFDLPVEVGAARVNARHGRKDHFENKDWTFHQKVRDAFLYLKHGNNRSALIDATMSIEEIQPHIQRAVLPYLSGARH